MRWPICVLLSCFTSIQSIPKEMSPSTSTYVAFWFCLEIYIFACYFNMIFSRISSLVFRVCWGYKQHSSCCFLAFSVVSSNEMICFLTFFLPFQWIMCLLAESRWISDSRYGYFRHHEARPPWCQHCLCWSCCLDGCVPVGIWSSRQTLFFNELSHHDSSTAGWCTRTSCR